MPHDRDLFEEEQHMVAMSFGDHIEDLRRHLVLALIGLAVGVILTFVPGIDLGMRIMRKMQDPAQAALDKFYDQQATKRSEEAAKAEEQGARAQPMMIELAADDFFEGLHKLAPDMKLPAAKALEGKTIPVRATFKLSEQIRATHVAVERRNALVSLAPMESMTIFFAVCLVAGLVIASPWVFYQIWAFIAAGLYRHERHYVKKYLPMSLGLFLAGVFLCFFVVLPVTLEFLLNFNVWLGIEPTLRISDWMGFATILPLVFGLCFQTPLVMLFLEKIGIFTVDDFKSKRRIAIFIMVVAAAVITPTQDPFSMLVLAVPMIALYELGILMMGKKANLPAKVAG